jgi:hypothetical protein
LKKQQKIALFAAYGIGFPCLITLIIVNTTIIHKTNYFFSLFFISLAQATEGNIFRVPEQLFLSLI